MGKGFKHGSGGGKGGTELNFSVVACAEESSLPETVSGENVICVITQTSFSQWCFSAAEPELPAEGMIWFLTGNTSIVEFDALKENSIQLCPLKARQYIDGAWVEVPAKIYQQGRWNAMVSDFVLYDRGTKNVTFTESGSGSLTENSGYLLLKTTSATYATFDLFASGTFDLTDYNTLQIESSNPTSGIICTAMVLDAEENVLLRVNAAQSSGTASGDISALTGKYTLKIRIYSESGEKSIRILSWKLLVT